MKEQTQYNVKVRLPSSEPEILQLFGYLIMPELPVRIAVRCSKDHYQHHDAILRGREVVFELDHVPTDEEFVAFKDLESRAPDWAVALAERLFEARGEFRLDLAAARKLSHAQIEALEGEINDLRARLEVERAVRRSSKARARDQKEVRSE